MSLYTKNCLFFGTSPKAKGHGLSFLFTPLVSTLVSSLENRYLTSLLYIIQKIMIFIYYCSLLNNEHEYLVIYRIRSSTAPLFNITSPFSKVLFWGFFLNRTPFFGQKVPFFRDFLN